MPAKKCAESPQTALNARCPAAKTARLPVHYLHLASHWPHDSSPSWSRPLQTCSSSSSPSQPVSQSVHLSMPTPRPSSFASLVLRVPNVPRIPESQASAFPNSHHLFVVRHANRSSIHDVYVVLRAPTSSTTYLFGVIALEMCVLHTMWRMPRESLVQLKIKCTELGHWSAATYRKTSERDPHYHPITVPRSM